VAVGGGRDPSTSWSVGALLVTTLCASTASLAVVTAIGKLVYDITSNELDLGLLGLVEFAPAALLVLVTGSVADRFSRRRVAAVAYLGEAVVTAALAVHVLGEPTGVGTIFLLVGGYGLARAFAAPASRALPADVVAPVQLPWLIPRMSGTHQVAVIVGPVLGGFLFTISPAAPMVAAALLQVAAAVAVSTVRTWRAPAGGPEPLADRAVIDRPQPAERPASPAPIPSSAPVPEAEEEQEQEEGEKAGWRDALEGIRLIRGQPVLLGAISLDLFAVLFGGAVALLPAIAEDRLGVDAVGLGWLRAAGGMGAGIVTLGLVLRPVRRRVGKVLLGVVATFGLGTIVLGLTTSFSVALVAMAVLSGADSVSVFIRSTLVPLVTPAAARGRVLAVENIFIGASNEAGDFESGVAGAAFGASTAVVLGGIGTLVVAAAWWFLFPRLRDIDDFPTEPDPVRSRAGPRVTPRPG
jgi:predicted MFS family arabinose efflux permease